MTTKNKSLEEQRWEDEFELIDMMEKHHLTYEEANERMARLKTQKALAIERTLAKAMTDGQEGQQPH